MRKLFALVALVLGVVSCQKDHAGMDVNMGGEQEVMINVSLPEETRANSVLGAFENVDFTKYDVRFQCEVHYGTEKKVLPVQISDNGKSATFPVRLIANRNYTFVVWADLVEQGETADLHYNTANGLANITLNDTWVAMDETRDAYTCSEVREFTRNPNISLELKRPFAKLRVITTDMKELMGIMPTSVEVKYTTNHFDTYNALTKTPSGELRKEHVQTAIASYNYQADDANKTLFTDYFFATETQNVVNFNMNVYDQNNELIDETKSFNTPIPAKRNYVTTIKGNILTYGDNITVEVKDAFEQPENIVDVITGTKTETMELTEGTYLFGDVTFNVEGEPAIVAKSGDVVIDIMNSMTINGVNGIVVNEGATLTINGLAETRSANRGGSLVIKATNGSAIAGKYITINNLASLTAIGNGDHAFGIGGDDAEVTINNTKVDYVAGGHIQPLFVNDTKYGKSEPEGGAAIGGTKVVIENSEIVKAEGGSKAAAIGNSYWNSTEVVIKNSELGDIFGGNASAAIGGSRYNNESKHDIKILIENSTITNAVGGEAGAGIGSGYDTHCNQQNYTAVNDIVIKKSNITAKGGKYSPGIGAGYHSAYLTGSIDAESTINSTAGNETFYKDTYTLAQNLGYGVMDPAREFSGANTNVTFTVAGNVISTPTLGVAEGVGKDLAGNYYIYNAEGLAWVEAQEDKYFAGKTIKLANDIDMTGVTIEKPIHFWNGRTTFDGQNYTISNLTMSTTSTEKKPFGLFGGTADIKNVKFDKANISGYSYVAVVAGNLYGNIENCHVSNSSVTCRYWMAGAMSGQYNAGNVTNCSVTNTTITGPAAVGALIGNINETAGERKVENCTVTGCTVAQNGSFGGDYDKMFGTAVGLVNIENSKVYINGCKVENTTVKGATSANIFGLSSDNTTIYVDDYTYTPDGIIKDENGNLIVNSLESLEAALETAGAAGAGDTTIVFAENAQLNMTDAEWEPIFVNGYNGADIVTIEGNGAVITGLEAPLFAGGFAGGSGIVIKDLTIKDSNIVSANTLGSGAFIESVDSMAKIELTNCHLLNSTVTGGAGSRTGGLIGWTAGYSNVNDGPVKTYVTIDGCSVIGCTITCDGSVGGINGHAGNNDWTYTTIKNCTIKNNTLASTDDGGWRVGVVVGTANVGEVTISNITESGNTLTQTGKTAPEGYLRNYYGRFVPGTTGKLTIDGYKYVAEGLFEDANGNAVVGNQTALADALAAGKTISLAAGEYTFPANVAEGVTINCQEGTVFTGTSGLNINGATVIGAEFKNENGTAVSGTINGTFKNCTFTGSEALRWCYSDAGKTNVFENCVIKTDFRGFHFDGMDGDVIFRNCEINGFNAYGGEGTATFEGCTFGCDESRYNGLNIYSNTNLINCTFNFVSGKTNFIDMEGTGKTLKITNCVATLDGVNADISTFVGGSKLADNTVIYE